MAPGGLSYSSLHPSRCIEYAQLECCIGDESASPHARGTYKDGVASGIRGPVLYYGVLARKVIRGSGLSAETCDHIIVIPPSFGAPGVDVTTKPRQLSPAGSGWFWPHRAASPLGSPSLALARENLRWRYNGMAKLYTRLTCPRMTSNVSNCAGTGVYYSLAVLPVTQFFHTAALSTLGLADA